MGYQSSLCQAMPGVKFFVYIFIISLLSQLPAKKYIYVLYIHTHIYIHVYMYTYRYACMYILLGMLRLVDLRCVAKPVPLAMRIPVLPKQS